ncbi:unnamed protein product [Alternaria alternata]
MFAPGKPKIKTRTVLVKKAPAPTANPLTVTTHSTRQRHTQSQRIRAAIEPIPVHPALASSRTGTRAQRKGTDTPQWASSDESSDDEDSDRLGVKRRRTRPASNSIEPMSLNRALEPDLKRRIRIEEADTKAKANGTSNGTSNGVANGTNGTSDMLKMAQENAAFRKKKAVSGKSTLKHGFEMTKDDVAKAYKSAFPGSEKKFTVELQYPSLSRPEKFEAVARKEVDEEYSPLDDIYFSIEEIIQHYLPPDLAAELSSDALGTVRLLKRAVTKDDPELFKAELAKFNKLIKDQYADGTIPRILDDMHAIPLSLVKRITAQSYNRIVSPHAHRLRKVEGKETTYGELLAPFVHKIFAQTGLNSTQTFVDLGSGVGNVVLQSALQTGAESWGIEKMKLAASLGSEQAAELKARSKLWNITLGRIELIEGDFLESPEIDEVLRRADVVLVNNKVFGETLNNLLLQKFLDLKQGCKVVSLESFGGGAKQGVRNEQSIAGLFDEEKYESGTNSVSWAGESVEYFIAEKAR